MAKAVFYLSGANAQHEGNRLLMSSKMIEHGFEKGAAFNLPDGRVEILLEGPADKIKEFHRIAKRDFLVWVKTKVMNRKTMEKQIGNPGIKFSELDFDNDLLVHKLEIYGHSLTFDQIYKGVDVYKDLTQAIKDLRKTMKKLQ